MNFTLRFHQLWLKNPRTEWRFYWIGKSLICMVHFPARHVWWPEGISYHMHSYARPQLLLIPWQAVAKSSPMFWKDLSRESWLLELILVPKILSGWIKFWNWWSISGLSDHQGGTDLDFGTEDLPRWKQVRWLLRHETLSIYPPVSSNMAMEGTLLIGDVPNFPIETSISSGFPSLPRLITGGYCTKDIKIFEVEVGHVGFTTWPDTFDMSGKPSFS